MRNILVFFLTRIQDNKNLPSLIGNIQQDKFFRSIIFRTSFRNEISNGNFLYVKYHLLGKKSEKGRLLISPTEINEFEQRLFFQVVKYGQINMFKFLFSRKNWDVSVKELIFLTSVIERKLNILEYLLDHFSLENISPTNKRYATSLAEYKGYKEISQFLISRGFPLPIVDENGDINMTINLTTVENLVKNLSNI